MSLFCSLLAGQGLFILSLLLTTKLASAQSGSSSLWPVQLGANANLNIDVDGTDAFNQLVGVNTSSNPMAVLVSEGGGRYEETEVNITYKQGELSKAPMPQRSTNHSTFTLKCGSQGIQVIELQGQLKALGFFQHDLTGYFGDITQDAVARFQRFSGMAVDGIAGPQTLDVLKKLSATQYIANSVSIPPDVRYAIVDPSNNRVLVQPVTQTSVIPEVSPTQSVLYSSKTATPQRNLPVAASNPATSIDGAKVGTELYIGSQGQIVRDLQQLLRQIGKYPGPITGYFGSLTLEAVKDFQSDYGLDATGIVGVKTLVALNDALNR